MLWNKKYLIERLNIFIRTSIERKWEQILHLAVHCVCMQIFEGESTNIIINTP